MNTVYYSIGINWIRLNISVNIKQIEFRILIISFDILLRISTDTAKLKHIENGKMMIVTANYVRLISNYAENQ